MQCDWNSLRYIWHIEESFHHTFICYSFIQTFALRHCSNWKLLSWFGGIYTQGAIVIYFHVLQTLNCGVIIRYYEKIHDDSHYMEKYWLRINSLTGYNHHKILKKVFTCLVLTEFKQIVFVIFHSISRSKLYMHCILDLTWKSKKVLQLVFCQINLGSGIRWSVLNATFNNISAKVCLWGRLHTGASKEKPKEASPIL